MATLFGLSFLTIPSFMMPDDGQKQEHFFNEAPDTKLAVLGDVCLRVEDTYCLEGNDWLHDNLLEFYLEYLRHVKYWESKDDIEIIGPSVTQCIKITNNLAVIGDMIDPLKLPRKKVVIIPINNARQGDSEGTHWSLMVLIPFTGNFYHLDSLNMNKEPAKILAVKLCKHLKMRHPMLEHFTGMRQNNDADCGLYVLLNADIALAHFLRSSSRDGFDPVKKDNINDMRQEILILLRKISSEQKKSK